jgi:ABC-2 type transport system permease protein
MTATRSPNGPATRRPATGTFDGIKLTARRELVERTRRDRSFLISTLVTLGILFAIIFLPRLFGASDPAEFDVGLVGSASQPLGQVLTAQGAAIDVQIRVQQPASAADAEAAVRDGRLDLAVIDGRQLVAEAEVDEQLNVLVQAASRIVRAQQTLERAGVPQAEIQAALAPPPLPVRSLEPVDEDAQSKRSIATVSVFLLYGQLIGYCFTVAMGVVEEKSTRVVEVLLAAIRPLQLLAGKIIGIGLVGLLQLAVVGVVGLAVAPASKTCLL